MINRVFIHGLESSSQGEKGQYFHKHYPDMLIEDYNGPFEARMDKLNRLLTEKDNLILVGSSYGGLMAEVYACENQDRVKKLILLAPALILPQFGPCQKMRLTLPVVVYHGKQDTVVPPEATRKIAEEVFTNLFYYAVTDDHSLHGHFEKMPWDCLLETRIND